VGGETTKEGDFYISFLTEEAKEAIRAYLRVRDAYKLDAARRIAKNISHSTGRHHQPWAKEASPPNEDSLFSFGYISAIIALKKALKQAGLFAKDPTTKIGTIHFHMFRKFFLSQVKAKGMPDAIAGALCSKPEAPPKSLVQIRPTHQFRLHGKNHLRSNDSIL
jgi:integrase